MNKSSVNGAFKQIYRVLYTHKGSKMIYFRFGHFYTIRKISSSSTRLRQPYSNWSIRFRVISCAQI